jgi:8-oxo-dGTP pyrophosphatase MutT (NUDIX family)
VTGRPRLEPRLLEQVLVPPSRYRDPQSHPRAAVAAIFAPGADDAELLFIQRATVERDPWSGQMAFPGGRHEPSDASSRSTAVRETHEEIGLDLSTARNLGSLSDVDGGRATNRPVTVSGHCFWLPAPPPPLALSIEVADVVWVPISQLLDPDRHIDYLYPRSGLLFPGIQLDKAEQVIWGLTLRFLSDLFARLDHPFLI